MIIIFIFFLVLTMMFTKKQTRMSRQIVQIPSECVFLHLVNGQRCAVVARSPANDNAHQLRMNEKKKINTSLMNGVLVTRTLLLMEHHTHICPPIV